MKVLIILALFIAMCSFAKNTYASATGNDTATHLYKKLNLKGKLDKNVFINGYNAYQNTKGKRKPLLTVIDYSMPSNKKRFFVFDLKNEKVVFNTYVAHGVNTGGEKATKFSNTVNSRKTSLGVFLTDATYYGGNGYSLTLDGLTPGKNDNARKRYIVVHGADYATERFIKKNGRLGRSWGCPALPSEVSRKIIDTIKGGSLIYAYGDRKSVV